MVCYIHSEDNFMVQLDAFRKFSLGSISQSSHLHYTISLLRYIMSTSVNQNLYIAPLAFTDMDLALEIAGSNHDVLESHTSQVWDRIEDKHFENEMVDGGIEDVVTEPKRTNRDICPACHEPCNNFRGWRKIVRNFSPS
jgi:hypothetical protein